MLLKSSLHFHTADDPWDIIYYSFQEAVDYLAKSNFAVLAITCHNKFIFSPEYSNYAASKNILLIPGIEASIQKKHTIILNANKDIETVRTFADLRVYKKSNPQILVIAPHPFAPHPYLKARTSLGRQLYKNLDLFDAFEITWFHSELTDPNKKTIKLAQERQIPLISTSDAHFLNYVNQYYCEIETQEKTIPAIFQAIKQNKIKNYSPNLGVIEYFLAYFKFNGHKK